MTKTNNQGYPSHLSFLDMALAPTDQASRLVQELNWRKTNASLHGSEDVLAPIEPGCHTTLEPGPSNVAHLPPGALLHDSGPGGWGDFVPRGPQGLVLIPPVPMNALQYEPPPSPELFPESEEGWASWPLAVFTGI